MDLTWNKIVTLWNLVMGWPSECSEGVHVYKSNDVTWWPKRIPLTKKDMHKNGGCLCKTCINIFKMHQTRGIQNEVGIQNKHLLLAINSKVCWRNSSDDESCSINGTGHL